MKKVMIITLLITLFSAEGLITAQADKYGKMITLMESIDISEIVQNPNRYENKELVFTGIITNVCKERGIWLDITGNGTYENVKCIIDKKYFSFPKDVKGKTGTIQGVFKKFASNDPLLINIMEPGDCRHCEDECFVNTFAPRHGRGGRRGRSRSYRPTTAATPDSLNVVFIKGAVIQ